MTLDAAIVLLRRRGATGTRVGSLVGAGPGGLRLVLLRCRTTTGVTLLTTLIQVLLELASKVNELVPRSGRSVVVSDGDPETGLKPGEVIVQ